MSAYETVRKIMVVNEPADEETRHLQIFHGLRALSIVWIVWVHHYAYNDTSVYSGAKIAKKLAVQYNTQPFNNAWLAVDTFFFISGFFLLYAIHKQMRSAGLAQALFYLAVRWWRFAKEVLEQIYFRPYTHFGPFCLGMAVAYSFVTKKPRFELNLVCQGAAWSAAFVAGAMVLFCTKQWGDGDALPEAWVAAVYAACHRLVWALCIGWLVFACISGRGGLVQSVLSSPLLVPLSRLSYAVYVLHVPLVWFRLWTIRERILIWFLPMFYNAMGTLVLAFFVALGASVFIERPLVVVKDLVLKWHVAPPSAKFSQRDGQPEKGGAKADGVHPGEPRTDSLETRSLRCDWFVCPQ
ncbi:hypothetical protein HPB48_011438 [Haemaphysalis longicornis]|uniref:Acyltransferase 3 domain-containing protein n=1 Tax=Haemaphysalis longicornis TaxID=44386 RepID=A0A9J6G607_HAELO|nr:hypothetical protein HPB48_011438 [Haemaphysalis longicornis]